MRPPSNPSPEAPVAFKCRCGNRIVLEPRWIGKPSACAACEADFVVSMLVDPKTGRRVPHVQYTPTVLPDRLKESNGARWANVTCDCGTKIGLDQRFMGKNMTCSSCGREFIVRNAPRSRSKGDTAIIQITRPPTKSRPAVKDVPSVIQLARSAPPPKKDEPAPPEEMHLLCTCGEELIVPASFYNHNMYCAGCGVLMHLRLEFSAARGKHELLARVLDQPKETAT